MRGHIKDGDKHRSWKDTVGQQLRNSLYRFIFFDYYRIPEDDEEDEGGTADGGGESHAATGGDAGDCNEKGEDGHHQHDKYDTTRFFVLT